MVHVALAPCSPFSVTGDLMRESASLARAYGVRLHTHLAETMDEERFCIEKFGALAGRLRRISRLDRRRRVACALRLPERRRDRALLRAPAAAWRIAPARTCGWHRGSHLCGAMRDAGVKVGLGVDGSASNDGNRSRSARHDRRCCSNA